MPPPESGVENQEPFRSGYVAILGAPNAGKSTLMNCLIGQEISVVTPKPQTTRHKILGILTKENFQAVFFDTPGLLDPKYLLHEAMMRFARNAAFDADLVCLVVDAAAFRDLGEAEKDPAFKLLKTIRKPVYLIINKIDILKKAQILPVILFYTQRFDFKEVFPISALSGEGTRDLLAAVVAELPVHPAYYPGDIVSEHSERFFVGEIIRGKIFEKFRDEIPYSTAVEILEFRERPGRKDLISAEIYVERESQKGILIGSRGKALKEVGELARKEIEKFLERGVFLELHVKVGEKWRDQESWLKRLGYR